MSFGVPIPRVWKRRRCIARGLTAYAAPGTDSQYAARGMPYIFSYGQLSWFRFARVQTEGPKSHMPKHGTAFQSIEYSAFHPGQVHPVI